MAGFSESSNRNNMLSSLWQQSNEQSNFMSRNDGYGQTLVLYRSKVFINLDGNTITDDSFNNKGNGNQDFSYADINRIVSAIRNKNSSPVPAPAPAINTVYTNPNQHHGSSSAGMSYAVMQCVLCKRTYPYQREINGVHCPPCNTTSYRH